MRFLAVFLGLSVHWLGAPAFACQQSLEYLNDRIPSPGFSLVIADVTDLTITKSSEAESCFTVSYSHTEQLFGSVRGSFRVETCSAEGPITEADLAGTDPLEDEFGFVEGATVLVGVITSGDAPDGLRYAVPSCFGPFHIRLDRMEAAERAAYVAEITASLLEAEASPAP